MTDYLPGHEAHYLPADAYPGLLDGWCGPLVDRAGGERIVCVDGTVWYVDCARTMRRDEADLAGDDDADRAAADRAALSAGYARREPGALLLPMPGGVVGRLEVSGAR